YQVTSLAWRPDGKRFASAGGEPGKPGEVKVWDAATWKEVVTLRGQTQSLTLLSWSPDGKWLAASTGDQAAIVWNATTGQVVRILESTAGKVDSLAWSPDSRLLAGGCFYQAAIIWDTTTGKEVRAIKAQRLRGHGERSSMEQVAWSPDGKHL